MSNFPRRFQYWPVALSLCAGLMATGHASAADLTERQAQLLANNCVQCHARANIGAPLMGNPDDWKERGKLGEEKLLANVIYGVRGMPPFGYCSACSEQDLRALIRFMANLPDPAPAGKKAGNKGGEQ
jgi:cytochrome c5